MPVYLQIAVNVARVSGIFDYHLPPELEGRVIPGCLVAVPFGQQIVQGVVLRIVERPSVAETRPVSELVDPSAVLTMQQIEFTSWLSSNCLAPLAACAGLMLPPGLAQRADTLYSLRLPLPGDPQELPPLQKRLVGLLQKRSPLRGGQIDAAMPPLKSGSGPDWRLEARKLVKSGWLSSQSFLPPPRIQPKRVRTAALAGSPDAVEAWIASQKPSPQLARRTAILKFLQREGVPVNTTWVYAESGGNLQDLYALEELGLVSLGESEVLRDPLANLELPAPGQTGEPRPLVLTPDQQAAWQLIRQGLEAGAGAVSSYGKSFLLHGVTGSGKTEIYLRAVEEALRQGRQAIILVPEISLTPQTVRRFSERFPGQVGLVHSALSDGERYDTWRRARSGQLGLVIGARSALFTPFPRLGLIVVDECHEDSYYQSEPEPHYHAREAALAYARICNGVCILGSATPDVTTFAQATALPKPATHYLQLPQRILGFRELALPGAAQHAPLPQVQLVDMRTELKSGNRSIFSRDLQQALAQVLQRQQQAILFLNRRGSATFVFCRDCGLTLKCPKCDLPLVFHTSSQSPESAQGRVQTLVCHHCRYERRLPKTCPVCGSANIRQFGTGTEKVEQEVQALFPQARTLRWDWETTRRKGAHEVILAHFLAHRADILVGTQMLAKGLDLPLVTLVGVILADVGLGLPDYTASERTFQVLAQVAGRAGRSPLGGRVVLQTFQPEHYVIQAAAAHDYTSFALRELQYRRELGYPPYVNLVRLETRHTDAETAEHKAQELARRIQEWIAADGLHLTRLVGPVPAFFARLAGLYRWQIIVKGPDPLKLLGREDRLRFLADWQVEVNPPSLL